MYVNGLLNYVNEVYTAYLRLKALTNCNDEYLNVLLDKAMKSDKSTLEIINEEIAEILKPKNKGAKKWITKNLSVLWVKIRKLKKLWKN